MTSKKDYLGDSVYADFDGYHIVLTTEDGIRATNRICLDESVVSALIRYMERTYDIKITMEKNKKDHE